MASVITTGDLQIQSSKKPVYYEEINLFRGFAIFTIVFGHSIGTLIGKGLNLTSSWRKLLELFASVFVWGGTWFFIFISGFLFYNVFYKRGIIYKRFMKSKLVKVFSPYMIFATAFFLLKYWLMPPGNLNADYILGCYQYSSFWYIPFVMCIFIMTPAFELYVTLSERAQLCILAISILIAIGIGRHNGDPVINCVYLCPGYLLGIYTAINYDKLLEADSKLIWTAFFIFACFAVCLNGTPYWGEVYYWHWEVKFYRAIKLGLLIKLGLCIFLLLFFHWLAKSRFTLCIKGLNILAAYSFTIFFFQQFLWLYLDYRPPTAFLKSLSFWPTQGLLFFGSLLFCFVTVLIFAPIKKALGRYSRRILGC